MYIIFKAQTLKAKHIHYNRIYFQNTYLLQSNLTIQKKIAQLLSYNTIPCIVYQVKNTLKYKRAGCKTSPFSNIKK
jgi:predicted transglutaminase-like protease